MLNGAMVPQLEELRLSDLSATINVAFFRGNSSINSAYDILVVKYSGEYPFGSLGNSVARFMFAMGNAGLHAYEPCGVIIDMSELHYEWGDMLEIVFGIGAGQYLDTEFPVATVVGPQCREAVRTLIHGENSKKQLEDIGWVFDSLELAWEHVDQLINKVA